MLNYMCARRYEKAEEISRSLPYLNRKSVGRPLSSVEEIEHIFQPC